MAASSQRLEVDQRILNKIAHDGQILCGNERRELRNQHPAAHHPVVNAPVVFEVFGSNMGNHVFGQSVELGRKAAHGTPPPHGPRGISCALSSSRHKQNLHTPHNYGASVNEGCSRQHAFRHNLHIATRFYHSPCYAPTVPLPRYDAKPRPFAWSWARERPSINSQSCGGVEESPASIPDYNGVKSPALVTAHGLSGKSCPLSRSEIGPQDTISKFTGGPNLGEAASASSVTKLKADAALILRRVA